MKLNIKVLPFSAEEKMARKFAQNLISILDSKDSKVLRIRIKKNFLRNRDVHVLLHGV